MDLWLGFSEQTENEVRPYGEGGERRNIFSTLVSLRVVSSRIRVDEG